MKKIFSIALIALTATTLFGQDKEFAGTVTIKNTPTAISTDSISVIKPDGTVGKSNVQVGNVVKLTGETSQTVEGQIEIQDRLTVKGLANTESATRTSVDITGKTGAGNGWAGVDLLSGYTHTPGVTDPLVTDVVAVGNVAYAITVTVSNLTAGRYEYFIFGGTRVNMYVGNGQRVFVFKTVDTSPLQIFITNTATDGDIKIDSVERVNSDKESVFDIKNSSNAIVSETRYGNGSVYFGSKSGVSSSSASSLNTAFGHNAIEKAVSSRYLTAVGTHALRQVIGGSYMTAIGANVFSRGFSHTGSNYYNVGIGGNVGNAPDANFSNSIFMGFSVAEKLEAGHSNIGIGCLALGEAVTSVRNVDIGNNSLRNLLTGSSNTALGIDTLVRLIEGTDNVAVGFNAGNSTPSGNNETSFRSIFIGKNTKSLADDQFNQIVIGNDAIGNGSNTATIGDDSITDTYLKGVVHADSFDGVLKNIKDSNGVQLGTVDQDLLLGEELTFNNTTKKIDVANVVKKTGETNQSIAGNITVSNKITSTELDVFADDLPTRIGRHSVQHLKIYGNSTGNYLLGVGSKNAIFGKEDKGVLLFRADGVQISTLAIPNRYDLFIKNDTGDVGVNNKFPTEKLHVNGNVKATNFIGNLSGNATTASNANLLGGELPAFYATQEDVEYKTNGIVIPRTKLPLTQFQVGTDQLYYTVVGNRLILTGNYKVTTGNPSTLAVGTLPIEARSEITRTIPILINSSAASITINTDGDITLDLSGFSTTSTNKTIKIDTEVTLLKL